MSAADQTAAGRTAVGAGRPWWRARHVELWVFGVVVLLDQITKFALRQTVGLYEIVPVVPGLLNLTHVRNTGAAFGLFDATDFAYKPLIMTLVGLIALLAIAFYAARLGPDERLARLGLALILGGAVGNLIDRATAGYVLDFIDFYWAGWHFWAFNVADAAITIGAAFMILDLLGAGRHVSNPV
jgi:signal peptidase II